MTSWVLEAIEREVVVLKEAQRREMVEGDLVQGPYPMCRHPFECARKGYCGEEIACNE